MKIYIAGPVTGLKDYNRESFNIAERVLLSMGHEVRNPAIFPDHWGNYDDYIEVGLVMLRQCDHIVMLPGHRRSKGATQEAAEAYKHSILDVSHLLLPVTKELNAQYLIARGVAR